jgi:phosphoribosylaminoimidazole (AIR) synthetase
LIAKTGSITDDEMREVFNLGIGLIAIVNKNDVEQTKEICKTINENVLELGVIV